MLQYMTTQKVYANLGCIHILVFYVDRAHCFYKILNMVDGPPKQVLEELN